MSLTSEQLVDNWQRVLDRIAKARAEYSARQSVDLLAVSKTKPASMVTALYQAGQRDFGENYLQDALTKIQQLEHLPDIRWHFIGQIQSNKTADIARHFDWAHSVDRLKIARRLSEQRPAQLPPLQICLQINLDGETQKGGIAPDTALELAQAVTELPQVCLRGLMAIPKPRQGFTEQLECLRKLQQLQSELIRQGLTLDTLSMGMSGDLGAAIAAGSTLVRIGTDIFGPRDYT